MSADNDSSFRLSLSVPNIILVTFSLFKSATAPLAKISDD